MNRETPVEVVLSSFGGETQKTQVFTPLTREQLQKTLREIREDSRKAIFRTGGMAFDTQSLNVGAEPGRAGCVVNLEKLTAIGEVTADGTVTAEAGARWGDVVKKAAAAGYVPYVTVSTHDASIGGTASADCLSRFSPTCGKEGAHIRSLLLQKPDGSDPVLCSRTANPKLFEAAVAGMGYVGAILEVTYELLELGYSGEDIAVKTEYDTFKGLSELAHKLVPAVSQARCDHPSVTGETAQAVAAVLYLDRHRHGVLMTSRYVRSREKKPNYLFQYKSLPNRLTQLGFVFPRLRNFMWRFAFRFVLRDNDTSIDTLDGFTFFQQGNVLLKDCLRRVGLKLQTRQQTYIVPVLDGDDTDATKNRLDEFLTKADKVMDDAGLVPALIDVLYLPKDLRDDFLLSSSRGMEGFAVTISFEGFLGRYMRKVEKALLDISEICHKQKGRVHLVKHVFAPQAMLKEMYPTWKTVQALREQPDIGRSLNNPFQDRTFNEI